MSTFTTMIASDDDHEEVFAEIYFAGKFIALVSQEEGINQLKVEFPGAGFDENLVLREISMDGFINALNEAKSRLVGEIPYKQTGERVPTPHVQGKDIPGGLRPANPDEIPK